MEIFNIRALTQKQRYKYAFVSGLLAAIVLGVLTGVIRKQIDFSLLVWLVGYGVAMAIRKLGRGVQLKFSVTGVAFTLIGILISDVIAIFGLAQIFDLQAYITVIQLVLNDDIGSIVWLVYRLIALYIAYNYSRVI
ncbi:hypothetical protein ERUR111494_07755 [Erysipelothrix urinaevulpis]|uniref:hypothetical protein n=1 Tax=Erysipelothrix urinaevulpis TaxID=2683717 RepID=UPI001356D56E|nr:hypothetical protein [Erysipelothrix urinaevulpis]